MRTIVAILMILVAIPVSAQWYDEFGKPLPDTNWRKSSDGLNAALVLTTEIDAFLEEWSTTPESHAPVLKPTSRAKRGDIVAALVVFSGCGTSKTSCNAVVDFKVLNPDGSVYGDIPFSRAWSGPSPKPRVVILSDAQLRIRIEPKDQLGKYTVLATFREADSGKQIRLRQEFTVTQ
jgi:hypothetical protein